MTDTIEVTEVYARAESVELRDGRQIRFRSKAPIVGLDDRRLRIEIPGMEWNNGVFDSEVAVIRAKKGRGHACYPECKAAGHYFEHEFGSGVVIEAVEGDLILEGPGPLWEWFEVKGATRWR